MKHLNVVCAVIEKDNKIFCCKRSDKKDCPNKWEFPGGKIEAGETEEEALKREIREEIGVEIDIKHHLITINHSYETFSLTLDVYKCELRNGVVTLYEHIDSIWCEKDKLKELDFVEADYKFLDLIK